MVTTLTYTDTVLTLLIPYILLILINALIARAIAKYNHRRRASYIRRFHYVANHYHLDDHEAVDVNYYGNHYKCETHAKNGSNSRCHSNTCSDKSKAGHHSNDSDSNTYSRNGQGDSSNLGMKAQIKVGGIVHATSLS